MTLPPLYNINSHLPCTATFFKILLILEPAIRYNNNLSERYFPELVPMKQDFQPFESERLQQLLLYGDKKTNYEYYQ